MPGYSRDLAWIHHAGFSDFVRSAAPGIIALLRRARISAGRVIELGCGSGVLAAELLRAGHCVMGVDISPAMIRLARHNAPGARFVTASLLEFRIPPCDAVISVGECINYCFDGASSRRAIRALFRRVHGALDPGGVFVFDAAGPGRATGRVWASGDGWAVLVNRREDLGRRILTREISSFRQCGRLWRRTDEVHTLRLFGEAELMSALKEAGFRARLLRGYGAFRLPAGHAVFFARKP